MPVDGLDATLTLESGTKEDELYGVEPASIAVGFSRSDLYLCENTQDRLVDSTGETVLIKLVASPASNDLDLAVLDLDGNVLMESAGETGNESYCIDLMRQMPMIQVSGYRGVSSQYALTVLSTCESDRDCPMGQVCNREFQICEEQAVVD